MTTDRASRGGKARAESLSPARRSEIARQGALAREQNTGKSAELPQATHRGQLRITDDLVLPCAVLSDGTRVITETAVAQQLGRGLGGKSRRLAARPGRGDVPPLPDYLTTTVERFVPDSLRITLSQPITYRDRGGPRRAVNAALLPEVCEVWLKARDAGELQPSQEPIARKAEALMRALSRVGVIALVDEATGYQEVRDRDELHRILAAYIHEELLPWAKRFPDEFYQQLFRLKGWEYKPPSVKRPQFMGKLTNELIYEKLPDGVLQQLREKNPLTSGGYRKHRHHQFLTMDIGNPHLERHVAAVTTAHAGFINLDAVQETVRPGIPAGDRAARASITGRR